MPRKTPQDKRAGKAAKKATKARKPARAASHPAAVKAAKKAAKKAASKTGGKKPAGTKTGKTTSAPAVKKARAAKAARRVAAKKAVARKSASGTAARKPARTGAAKTGARNTGARNAGGKPQPAPRRTAPRISAGRRATPRKTASREALVKKTVSKKAAPGKSDARAPRIAGKTAGKTAGAKKPAGARKSAAGKAKGGEALAAGARAPGHGAAKPARKTARARIAGRASQKLTAPVLRDGTRRRVEKQTAPRPEKATAPARKQPFRAHALGVREEHATDRPRIEALLTQAFGNSGEARIVQELRDAGDLICALVAEYEGDIVGYIAFSRADAQIDGRAVKAAALAPLAVAPARQGRGVGSVLVSSGLEAVSAAGLHAVFVVGDKAYYERFGFSMDAAAPCESPWKDALLALELEPQALSGSAGTIVHPAPLRP